MFPANPPFYQSIFSAAAATSTGSAINVEVYQNIMLFLGTASSANFTIKIQGSLAKTQPDFSVAATVTNPWGYIGAYDMDSAVFTAGSTGYTSAGTDVFKNILVNTNGLTWVCATITARSAGTVTLTGTLHNNV